MQDITLQNNRGIDTQNYAQQVALYDRGTKNIYKNVKLFSYQDTYVSNGRGYFEDSDIYGCVDYICGNGDIYFNRCLLFNRGADGNKITAPSTDGSFKWGYVFMNCTVDGGDYVLGRPWQNEPRAFFLNTKLNKQPVGTGWEAMGNLRTHFYEYNSMDHNGNVLSLESRGNSPTSQNSYSPILTDDQADEFTITNVLGGKDGYDPTAYTVQIEAPELSLDKNILSWTNVENSICAVIFKNGKYFATTVENSIELDENGVYSVRLANERGGLGESSEITLNVTGIDSVEAEENGKGICYDILGRKLDNEPAKGFYIRNGKKIVK